MSFSIPAPIKRHRRARFFRKVVAQSCPIWIVIQFSRYNEKVFHLFPLGRAKLSGVFEKFFGLKKILSLIWTKGAEMHTHFWGFLRKIFIQWKYPLTYLELQSQMTPYFTEKMRKYFFGCGCFILLAPKNPFTYSHWEQTNAHPKSQKIFYPFTYLELRSWNAPCFYKNGEKYFFRLRALILLAQKSLHLFGIGMPKRNLFFRKNRKNFLRRLFVSKAFPHLFPLGKGVWGQWFWKKAKKFARREWRAEI